MKFLTMLLLLFSTQFLIRAQKVLLEAESFDNPGGQVINPQFEQQMGSPYLMVHGMGIPVLNADTKVNFSEFGAYHIWVRTMSWVPGEWETPGRFQLKVGDNTLGRELGKSSGWGWEYAGSTQIKTKVKKV